MCRIYQNLRKRKLPKAKIMKKIHQYGIRYYQSNGAGPVFSSLTVTFFFKINFWHFISFANISKIVRNRANVIIASKWEVMHLPSNSVIAHVVHCDLDLYFQGHEK